MSAHMETVRKSLDGKTLLTRRPSGYAVSAWVEAWSPAGRIHVGEWRTLIRGADYAGASARFVAHTGEPELIATEA